VFGLTQVTSLVAHDVSVHSIVRGLLVLALLWWSGHDEPLTLAALYGGVALYLLAYVGFRIRVLHTVTVQRVVVAIALLVLAPLTALLTTLIALAVLASVLVLLIDYEVPRFASARDSVRHGPATPATPA
jgi:lysylphosphatidylglycerol synthetase-like protein (DUF2156 family)